jgi:hypothetical protein
MLQPGTAQQRVRESRRGPQRARRPLDASPPGNLAAPRKLRIGVPIDPAAADFARNRPLVDEYRFDATIVAVAR